MKILLINSHYPPLVSGGAELIARDQAISLTERGMEVVVLTTGPRRGLNSESVDGIRVWRAGTRNIYPLQLRVGEPAWKRMLWHTVDTYNPWMAQYVTSVCDIEKPDVALCHNLQGWSISTWDALTAARVPIVQVLHDQYFVCPKTTMFDGRSVCQSQCASCRILRIPHPRKSNLVSAVIGVSRFILERLSSYGYFERVAQKGVIYNVRPAPPNVSTRVDASEEVEFGFMGALAPHKGIELLLATFAEHAPAHWRLRIAGDGDSSYVAQLKDRYADPRIIFLGQTPPSAFFEHIDVTIIPSLWEETLANVAVESILHGVPVVASRRGGLPEVVSSAEVGMLFDPQNPNELAKCMRAMAAEVDLWRAKRIEVAGMLSYLSDRNAWTTEWLRILTTVVENPRVSAATSPAL